MKIMYATMSAAVAILLSAGLALAQGAYPPGVNPSNPQDLTNRSNPMSLTVPGASNPNDLVRSPAAPRWFAAPRPRPGDGSPPPSLSLGIPTRSS